MKIAALASHWSGVDRVSFHVLLAFPLAAPLGGGQARLFGDLHDMLPTDAATTVAVALGDLDGDGDLDSYLASGIFGASPADRVYRNDGWGLFSRDAAALPVDADDGQAVALADVDGDLDLDAFVGNGNSSWPLGQNRLYLNDGAGFFIDATANLPSDVDDTQAVALGDVDGDGDLDAFVGNGYTVVLPTPHRLYLNDGAGIFADAATSLPPETETAAAVALGDVDGDLDLDAYLANGSGSNYPSRQDSLYVNDGTGTFSDVTNQIPFDDEYPGAVAAGDVDGDVDVDLLVGNLGYCGYCGCSVANRLYRNDGGGTFSDSSASLPANPDATYGIALGDLDADSDLDAFLANAMDFCGDGGQDRVYRNDGAGVFLEASGDLPAAADDTYAIALGDVDGDRDLDALLGNGRGATELQDRVLLNDGGASFAEVTGPLPYDGGGACVAAADVDGDGDSDLLFGGVNDRFYRNDGTGVWNDSSATLPQGGAGVWATQDIAFGDVDGDADLDAYMAKGYSGECCWGTEALYLNDGSGAFTDASGNLPPGTGRVVTAALVDADGDADLDAVTGSSYVRYGSCGSYTRLDRNDGTGVFANDPSAFPLQPESSIDVAMGDLDGDGDLDAYFAAHCPNDRLYLNDGTGIFADATANVPLTGYNVIGAAVGIGDLDGDLDLDVLVGNRYGWGPRLYLNDGAALFQDDSSNLPTVPDGIEGLALDDSDGDLDLDAFLANTGTYGGPPGQNRLLANDGSSVFTDATATALPPALEFGSDVVLFDADLDGDRDAAISAWGQNRYQANLSRQLAWRSLPRIGKPLVLDVYGPPLGVFALLVSIGTGAIQTPYGLYRLDPAFVRLAGSGFLDASGRGASAFAVPPNAALIGFALHWQSFVGFPVALTNLESTRFTGF